jgi:hypothetical protein
MRGREMHIKTLVERWEDDIEVGKGKVVPVL